MRARSRKPSMRVRENFCFLNKRRASEKKRSGRTLPCGGAVHLFANTLRMTWSFVALTLVVVCSAQAVAKKSAFKKAVQTSVGSLLDSLNCATADCAAFRAEPDTETCPAFATCSKSGDLLSLTLSDAALDGYLPASTIAELDSLESIKLGGNALRGTLPSLAALGALSVLWLDRNQFTNGTSLIARPPPITAHCRPPTANDNHTATLKNLPKKPSISAT